MSYNKTTWQTGDKITAAKMNKIEDGIAAAEQSGGGMAGLLVIPEGWDSLGTHFLGFIGYFRQDNGLWRTDYSTKEVFWYNNGITSYNVIYPPSTSGIKVFWAIYRPNLDGVDLSFSGDISSTEVTVYDNDGQYAGYEISGIGYVTAVMT